MAVWLDLLKHLEDGLNTDSRLHVEAIYTSRLPGWLSEPLRDVRQNAGAAVPVLVLNVKSAATLDSLCILRLADFETLTSETMENDTHDCRRI